MTVTIDDIELARRRLRGIIKPTPLLKSATLQRMLAADVLIKPENLQKTGSFKIRGAYNRIASLAKEELAQGVITASAGNHGQALAYAASRAGVKATIVMPQTAPIAKVDATGSYGQTVVLKGADYQAAHREAEEIRRHSGAMFVDAYNDPLVIAGQGTIGLEIADEAEPDVVMVPVGGGGLIAGIAVALAARAPRAILIGVEAAGSPQLSLSLKQGAPASVESPVDTIADGLATARIGAIPFELIRERVKQVVTVDDFEIGEAVLLMLERMKMLVEGVGATALAGALKLRDALKGKCAVIVASGGNIDINLLDRIIWHGLTKVGRVLRFAIDMRDRPGELGKFAAAVGELGANVRSIDHDRTRRNVAIGSARVIVELETRGPEHIKNIKQDLTGRGWTILTEGVE
jgi:threonine dehydratase